MSNSNKPTVICVYEGQKYGLTDIIRGLVSIYKLCKNLELQFKINIVEPINLSDFLLPNKYNWKISQEEIAVAEQENNKIDLTGYDSAQDALHKIKAKCENHNYLFVVSNTEFAQKEEYGELFEELFRPTEELRNAIDLHLKRIGNNFVSATFRFQQLLGDFTDDGGNDPIVLTSPKREVFLKQCLKHLDEIHKENLEKKVFVASDSISFLTTVQKLDYVYVVPGEIAHAGNDSLKNIEKNVWTKYFLDYFLLKHSLRIYQIIDGLMYRSAIPRIAAMHGKVDFIVRNHNEIVFNKIVQQLGRSFSGNIAKEIREKESLIQQALSQLRHPYYLKNSGLDVYEKLQDDKSRMIFIKLFYLNYVSNSNKHLRFCSKFQKFIRKLFPCKTNFLSFTSIVEAKETIRRCKPDLTINIYSKQDIVELPACFLQFVPEYKFYIHGYNFFTGKGVLCAIIDKNCK